MTETRLTHDEVDAAFEIAKGTEDGKVPGDTKEDRLAIVREKVRENRLRRMADRQGFALTKSRRRDPRAADFGRYFIADARTNLLLTPEFGLDLDDVERWLTEGATRGDLAEHFRNQAKWRQGMYDEWEDRRNLNAARALERLAAHVDHLAEGDARVAKICPSGEVWISEEGHEMARLYGFHGAAEDPDTFLDRLAETCDTVED